ncbi:MAG: YihY/virulence factor BrkB family protein [Terracidiphilus sp.]
MAEDLNHDTQPDAAVEVVRAADVPQPAKQSKWYRWRKDGTALMKYLLDSEVQTYAFSVAANAILSFIPVIVLLYTISRGVFHSQAMVGVVNDMVQYFLPSAQDSLIPDPSQPDWAAKHLMLLAPRHGVQAFSVLMILISCTGIFVPLEVALNQAWGVAKGRNIVMNQVVAFGLALVMVTLGLGSMLLNAGARGALALIFVHQTNIKFLDTVLHFTYLGTSFLLLTVTTGVASILFFFCIYWILPNRRVPWRHVMKTAIYTGLIWLVAKYIFVLLLPFMHLEDLYGPFKLSVGLLFWAYASGLILFAGAQFSVTRLVKKES